MAGEYNKVIAYIGDNRDVLRKIQQIAVANQKLTSQIGQDFTRSAKVAGDGFRSIKETFKFDKETQAFSKFGGSVDSFSQKIKGGNGQLVQFTQTTKENAKGIKSVTNSYKDLDKNTVSLGENISRLAKRAALTIPLWLALRGVITGTIRAIGDSVKNLIEFDRALQKLKRNLQGTPEEIQRSFDIARQEITKFAIETGKSTEDVTRAVQKFATVGFDFETSMQAGLDATRLSVLLFGEAEETANAFARGLRALASDVEDTAQTQDEISRALALTSELWEVNAFELDELNQGFSKFAGTAKSMNFTIEETLTLLAALSTRGLNAERAGTLLRTSTQKLEQNLDKVAKVLGIQVNPEVDRTFDVFVRVTNAISKLKSEAGTISPAVSKAIGDLFGGVRGGEPVRDIIADMDKVNEAFNKFAKVRPDIIGFRKDFEKMNDTIFRQVEIMHNLNKETGKAFLTGITGGKDFLDSLKIINNVLGSLQKNAERTGSTLKNMFLLATTGGVGFGYIKFQDAKKKAAQAAENLQIEIRDALQGQLKDLDLRNLIIKLNKLDPKKTKISQQVFNALGKQLQKQLSDAFEESPIEVDAQVRAKNLQYENDRQELAELLLKSELESLKAIGATNSELLKAEGTYSKILGLAEEEKDILQRKLDLERSINEERRLQSRLGSDSIKLFRIAQEQGTDVAKKIGEVLSGQSDFTNFVRQGGQALEVFKDKFADIYEQQQAMAFFKGNVVPGTTGLRGGFGIPIEEEAVRRPINRAALTLAASREGLLGTKGLTPTQIQEFQAKNLNVETLNLPIGGGRGLQVLGNYLMQSLPTRPVAGALTNADIARLPKEVPETRIELNFNAGSFVFHGSPEDKEAQESFKQSIIKAFNDPLLKKKMSNLQAGNNQTNVF